MDQLESEMSCVTDHEESVMSGEFAEVWPFLVVVLHS